MAYSKNHVAVGLLAFGLWLGPAAALVHGQQRNFDSLMNPLGSREQMVEPIVWTTRIVAQPDRQSGFLVVAAQLQPGFALYSLTHPGEAATKIEVARQPGFAIAGAFRPDRAPVVAEYGRGDAREEKHVETVEFYLPIKLAAGQIPEDLEIRVRVNGQACSDSSCVPVINKVMTAKFDEYLLRDDLRYASESSGSTIR
jgi:hypothetical protein